MRRSIALASAVLGLTASGLVGLSTASADPGPADVAVGSFTRNLTGFSVFTETSAGARVVGSYRGLRANRPYFTVAYTNGNCDPAQAYPVGPFQTGDAGRGRLNATFPLTADLGKTGSISVRRGDTAADLDGDGVTGPGDVVAKPGHPGFGLVECDYSPLVFTG